MSADVTTVAAPEFGDSSWARWAAFVLIGWGIAVVFFGLVFIVQGVLYDDRYNMGYGQLGIAIGMFIGLAGLLHVLAGVYVLRHRPWARVLGIVIGLLGAALALYVLPSAFNTVYTRGINDEVVAGGPNMTAVIIGLSVVPYGLIIVGLVLGGRQFRRQT